MSDTFNYEFNWNRNVLLWIDINIKNTAASELFDENKYKAHIFNDTMLFSAEKHIK